MVTSPGVVVLRWWKIGVVGLILRDGVDVQVATIAFLVATIARWWTMQKRHQPKTSTAWPRWLPDVGLDDPEATSTEDIHRVAALARVAAWRRAVLAAFLVATIAFLVATIARWWMVLQ
jgi:hypothetical protein